MGKKKRSEREQERLRKRLIAFRIRKTNERLKEKQEAIRQLEESIARTADDHVCEPPGPIEEATHEDDHGAAALLCHSAACSVPVDDWFSDNYEWPELLSPSPAPLAAEELQWHAQSSLPNAEEVQTANLGHASDTEAPFGLRPTPIDEVAVLPLRHAEEFGACVLTLLPDTDAAPTTLQGSPTKSPTTVARSLTPSNATIKTSSPTPKEPATLHVREVSEPASLHVEEPQHGLNPRRLRQPCVHGNGW